MIVLDRCAVIRSFGLLMGGLPLDSAFWRFLTAMSFLSSAITCLGVHGRKNAGLQKRSAHGAPNATGLAYRTRPIDIESSLLTFPSRFVTNHSNTSSKWLPRQHPRVRPASVAGDRSSYEHAHCEDFAQHGSSRKPATVLQCSECVSISPSTNLSKFKNMANISQPPPRPASRPMPPLRLPFAV